MAAPAPQIDHGMTAEELYALGPDVRAELVRGAVIPMSPNNNRHGTLLLRLSMFLGQFIEERSLGWAGAGDVGFIPARHPDVVRAPDLAFIQAAHIPAEGLPESGFISGPPDLAIEILSPSDTFAASTEKAEDFLSAGAAEVWLVQPARREVRVLTGAPPTVSVRIFRAPQTLATELLPGFSLALERLFT
jgi:Uma2 family endonuclease